MMKHLYKTVVASAIAMAVTGAPALSQSTSQTVEEMTANFKKQKTRGLAIATPTTSSESANSNTVAATQPTVSGDTTMPTAVAMVPKEEQVNVNVSFDFDSAALREDQKPKLAGLCVALKAADVQKIRILGHTDASGSAEYNQRLSKLRAQEVKRFLVADCGYPENRMEALGVGEEFLFNKENPRADENRRVEFQALS